MVKIAYISEYKTELCMTPDFFGETIHDTLEPYVVEYHIIDNNEKDKTKFTWCVQHKIGDKTKTVDELAEIAKKIKAKYIKINTKQ